MKNEFTYLPTEKLYHIHLGVNSQLGYTIVCQEGFDIACKSHDGYWGLSARGRYPAAFSKGKIKILHRTLINAPWYMDFDHINGNSLDNRIVNLQLITESQNLAKSKLRKDSFSGFRGVSFHKRIGKWQAYIDVNKKRTTLGIYYTAIDAAKAYNKASKEFFGEFGFQNVIP